MRDTPYFCDLRPGGKYVAKDMYEVGGVPVVLKELKKLGLLHDDCITASGRTIGEELDEIRGASSIPPPPPSPPRAASWACAATSPPMGPS